jgi:WD40 repeat protein
MILGVRRWPSAVIAAVVLSSVSGPPLAAADRPVKPVATFQSDRWVSSLAFTPNGKAVVVSDLVLRDVVSGKVLGKGDPGSEFPPCTCVAFSPDGRRLASAHFDRGLVDPPHAICLWDVSAKNELQKATTLLHAKDQPHLYEESLHYLAFSPDGRMLATRLPGDRTVIWETASGLARLRLDTHGLAVAFAPDGRTLTTVTRTGLVQHWDLATGKWRDAAEGARREDFLFVCNAVASADGKALAITDHHTVLLKDAATGKTLRRFDDVDGECIALSPDGKILAVADGGFLLDTATGKVTGWLGEGKKPIVALTFSPDGKSLAVGREKAIEVWKVDALARDLIGRPSPASSLEARIVSRKETYTLDLGGKTSEEFARQFNREKPLPPAPEVDLVLTLRNTTDKELTFESNASINLHLVGDGALNHPELPSPPAFPPLRKHVTLAPGETYSVPIKSLDQGDSQRSYWLVPGEYTLHVSYSTIVKPVPEGSREIANGWGYSTVRAAPLRLKVVAPTK